MIKNHNGKVIRVHSIKTNADVIVVCEKWDIINWLVENGVLSNSGVNILLATSKGSADTAFKAAIRKCTNIKITCVVFFFY